MYIDLLSIIKECLNHVLGDGMHAVGVVMGMSLGAGTLSFILRLCPLINTLFSFRKY